jgi:hypothetical protein
MLRGGDVQLQAASPIFPAHEQRAAMEDETHAGAWPAEMWLAGEQPETESQAEPARGNVIDKLEDVKEKLGPKVEAIKEMLDPKLENPKGKFGQTVAKLFRKK